MSFMFNPFPYKDPDAKNYIENNGTINLSHTAQGNSQVAAFLSKNLNKNTVVAIDGYTTAPFEAVNSLIGGEVEFINVASIYKTAQELRELFAENLPMDKVKDPVLLYGKLFKGGFKGIFDEAKLAKLQDKLKNKAGKTIVLYGNGALSEELFDLSDVRVWVDVTPMQAVLNVKKGTFRNYGNDEDIPYKATMRRCYYVDFELSFTLRCKLLANKQIDLYICGDEPTNLSLIENDALNAMFERVLDYPFRQRPVYLEGVWGGYRTMKQRNLPNTMKNCAWIFDMIPMEVSTVIVVDNHEFAFPFYALVAACGEKMMGSRCMDMFHGFFPVRFNYDDTYHASGNMSIQLHPGADFVVPNHNELGRQDESYYIIETAQGARTYLGFNNGQDPDEFIREVKRSEVDHQPVDYQKYIYSVESKPGIQVMIPAGTIHGSGKNQLILEIGSLTVGSYTYKMYDYLRKDLDGNPRPIHTYFGDINLNRNMMEDYVKEHLVQGGYRVIRKNEEGQEFVVGECEQLYFSLRNLKFGDHFTDETDGDFHVIALVDGEDVTVRSIDHPELKFDMKYLDIVVVPASFGKYEYINNKPGTWTTIHKTMLKK